MEKKQKTLLIALLFLVFFTFPLISNISGSMLPFWKDSFNLSGTIITFLGSMIFLATGLTSLHQGMWLNKYGNKKILISGGLLILIPAIIFGLFPNYITGLVCLFIMGVGITSINIVSNMLVGKIDSNPAKYSQNLTVSQTFCSIGGASGGMFLALLIKYFHLEWKSMYFVIALLSAIITIFTILIKIPENETLKIANKQPSAGDYMHLLKNKMVIVFALGIFIYIGIESGVATWISSYLMKNYNMAKLDSVKAVSLFWILQAVGRFSSSYILKFINTSKAILIYSLSAIFCLLFAIFTQNSIISVISFALLGYFTSIMFPCIFSLAINTFEDERKKNLTGGILCASIIGGAFFAPTIGFISDITGSLGISLTIIGTLAFLYLAYIGLITSKKNYLAESIEVTE